MPHPSLLGWRERGPWQCLCRGFGGAPARAPVPIALSWTTPLGTAGRRSPPPCNNRGPWQAMSSNCASWPQGRDLNQQVTWGPHLVPRRAKAALDQPLDGFPTLALPAPATLSMPPPRQHGHAFWPPALPSPPTPSCPQDLGILTLEAASCLLGHSWPYPILSCQVTCLVRVPQPWGLCPLQARQSTCLGSLGLAPAHCAMAAEVTASLWLPSEPQGASCPPSPREPAPKLTELSAAPRPGMQQWRPRSADHVAPAGVP